MDEFAIDLDKVLDEFEQSEGGNASDFGGFQHEQLPNKVWIEDCDQSRLPSHLPVFKAFDLDLAEADFAPSAWKYETQFPENGSIGNDLPAAKPAIASETDRTQSQNESGKSIPAHDFPAEVGTSTASSTQDYDVAPHRNGNNRNDTSAPVPSRDIDSDVHPSSHVNMLHNKNGNDQDLPAMTAEVDVLSACLHAAVVPQVHSSVRQEENEVNNEVVTSPPDIVCSAPDIVSSAFVGVDVVPPTCTEPNLSLKSRELTIDKKSVLRDPQEHHNELSSNNLLGNRVVSSSASACTSASLNDKPVVDETERKTEGNNGCDSVSLDFNSSAPECSTDILSVISSSSKIRENCIEDRDTGVDVVNSQCDSDAKISRELSEHCVSEHIHKVVDSAEVPSYSTDEASHVSSADALTNSGLEETSQKEEAQEIPKNKELRQGSNTDIPDESLSSGLGLDMGNEGGDSVSKNMDSVPPRGNTELATDFEHEICKETVNVDSAVNDYHDDAETKHRNDSELKTEVTDDEKMRHAEPELKSVLEEYKDTLPKDEAPDELCEDKAGNSLQQNIGPDAEGTQVMNDAAAAAEYSDGELDEVSDKDAMEKDELDEDYAKYSDEQSNVIGFYGVSDDNDMTEEEIETYLRELDMNANAETKHRVQKAFAASVVIDRNPENESQSDECVGYLEGSGEQLATEINSNYALENAFELVSDVVTFEKTPVVNSEDELASSNDVNPLNLVSSHNESFMILDGNDADMACDVRVDGDHSQFPEAFGNLAGDQLHNLMRDAAEEAEKMIINSPGSETNCDDVNANGVDFERSEFKVDDAETCKSCEESFENQAVVVVCDGSEIKEDYQNSLIAEEPGKSDYLQRAVVGKPECVYASVVRSTDNKIGVDRSLSLPLPSTNQSDLQSGITSHVTSRSLSENLPQDSYEAPPSEVGTGARQKQARIIKPEILESTSEAQMNASDSTSTQATESASSVATSLDTQPRTPPVLVSTASPFGASPTIPLCSNINLEITQLGKVAPVWLPDAEASKCMACEVAFSFTRRRHHCRACGKVFCHACSNLRATLPYLENKQDRVCAKCCQDLVRATYFERGQPAVSMRPSGSDDVAAQVSSSVQIPTSSEVHQQPLPPTGVLRKQGSMKVSGEAKQVMFSDGIRPGGPLAELDGSSDGRSTTRRSRKADKSSATATTTATGTVAATAGPTKSLPETKRSNCLVSSSSLPPVVTVSATNGEVTLRDNIPPEVILQQIRNVQDASPVTFTINREVLVLVKIINLDCCVNRLCWCFTTKGLCTVGQDEIVIILECLPEEKTVPLDILRHLHIIYEMASHGNTVNNLDHTVLPPGSLGSQDVGGFLYVRQSFQCLQKIILPEPPFLFGLLLQKWEMPWARVFPLRLMFRLGAEFRYYPCPLISVRNRKPVYGEIGHTIMNLLADFHNYQYMVPRINGLVILMEDKRTTVSIPRNRHSMLVKILNNSDDHVIALGASFSATADSHLVCLQNDDGNYQTQAINIQNRPRRVTGACFIVFNGALKPTSGLRAKSSIVEDGLMVQITAEAMTELKQMLNEMKDYKILCGSVEVIQPDEMVTIEWNNDEKNINAGVKSPIDGLSMYGIDCIRIHSSTDYTKEQLVIRWTEVFVIRNGSSDGTATETAASDVSHLAETLATACCQALVGHITQLAFEMLTKIGLRVTIDTEQVGYEIGSRGVRLPDYCMNDLDEKLIGVIHGAAPQARAGPIVLELIFHIIRPYTTRSDTNPKHAAK